MPLKLMHLSPTSRTSSAAGAGAAPRSVATRCSTASESGELSVKVAAAYCRNVC